MGQTARRKRDTPRAMEETLAALVEFSERKTTLKTAQSTLTAVLHESPVLHLGDVRHALAGSAPSEIPPWSAAHFEDFREELRGFLLALAVKVGRAAGENKGSMLPNDIPLGALQMTAAAVGSEVLLVVDGAPRDVLWFQTLMLLRAVGLERVRRCPECARLFVKIGKRDYCRARCQNTNNQRRYRQSRRARTARRRGGSLSPQLSPRRGKPS